MTLQTFQNPSNLCHIVPYGLPRRATTVAQNGTRKHKPLKTNKKTNVVQSKSPFRTTKPLILLSETPLQLQLRKCVFLIGPQGRNPISSRFPSVTSAPLLPKSRAGLGPPLSWWSSLQPSDRH